MYKNRHTCTDRNKNIIMCTQVKKKTAWIDEYGYFNNLNMQI